LVTNLLHSNNIRNTEKTGRLNWIVNTCTSFQFGR